MEWMFFNHKKHSVLQNSMMKLLTKQKVNEGGFTALGTQMVSIAQTTLNKIKTSERYCRE